jgi:type VI secretion system secreted protein Hcp
LPILSTEGKDMATDIYVQIEGIMGESADSQHRGWIEALHVDWAVIQPRSATASTAGGDTTERAQFDELTLIKHADLSSPILMQTCSMGRTLPKAKINFMRADGHGERIRYFEIELENVLLGHVQSIIQPGDILAESVGLKFSKAKWRYTQQRIGGGAGGNTAGEWDLALNRIAL